MPVIIRAVESVLHVTHSVLVANGSTLPFYGTLEKANNYHGSMLEGQLWSSTPRLRQVQALVSATKRIDRLNFVGVKSVISQPLQFPRGTDTLVPVDIEQACYEVALALLSGVDPDTEHANLGMIVQDYGRLLRSEFDRGFVPTYFAAGIPSHTAWNLLLPYLEEQRGIQLRRIS